MSTKLQAKKRAEANGEQFVDTTLPDPKKKYNVNTHYVRNDDLRNELIKSKEQGELTETAVCMIMQIAEKLSLKLKYTDPQDREDCVAYAIMDCIKYWRGYDPNITKNAFAYMTTICTNGFAKGWRALGKLKCPDSLKIPISEAIYSL